MINTRLINSFVYSSAAILFVTGAAKIFNVAGGYSVLQTNDPIFGIPLGDLMVLVSIAELVVASFCVSSSKNPLLRTTVVTCMATAFLAYRGGLWVLNWERPCGCLGALTDGLGITPRIAENITLTFLAFMLIGGYGIILSSYLDSSNSSRYRLDTAQPN